MRPPALTGSASGAQRLAWLLPALLLLGISDTDLPPAVCAAVLGVLVALGPASWPERATSAVSLLALVAALLGTEHLLWIGERAYGARDEGTVPAGT